MSYLSPRSNLRQKEAVVLEKPRSGYEHGNVEFKNERKEILSDIGAFDRGR